MSAPSLAVNWSPPSTINDPRLRVAALAKDALLLGAVVSHRRLELVRAHLGMLTPEVVFQWMQPEAILAEVQAIEAKRMDPWHVARNILALCPLILTWLALSIATIEYQRDLQTYKDDLNQPFLALWQNGFHGVTFFTFSFTGFTDFAFLLGIALITFWTYVIEQRSARRIAGFNTAVLETTQEVIDYVSGTQPIALPPDASVTDIAQAVQRVIDRALAASQEATAQAQAGMQALLTQSQQLFGAQVQPLIAEFRQSVATLHQELHAYQTRLNDLTTASGQIGTAAATLAANAGAYSTVASDIRQQVAALNTTQQQLVAQIGAVASGVGNASASMEALAREMGTNMQTNVQAMATNVTHAAQALQQVELQLEITTQQLQRAATSLSSINIVGGGLIGYLMQTGRNRRIQQTNGSTPT